MYLVPNKDIKSPLICRCTISSLFCHGGKWHWCEKFAVSGSELTKKTSLGCIQCMHKQWAGLASLVPCSCKPGGFPVLAGAQWALHSLRGCLQGVFREWHWEMWVEHWCDATHCPGPCCHCAAAWGGVRHRAAGEGIHEEQGICARLGAVKIVPAWEVRKQQSPSRR